MEEIWKSSLCPNNKQKAEWTEVWITSDPSEKHSHGENHCPLPTQTVETGRWTQRTTAYPCRKQYRGGETSITINKLLEAERGQVSLTKTPRGCSQRVACPPPPHHHIHTQTRLCEFYLLKTYQVFIMNIRENPPVLLAGAEENKPLWNMPECPTLFDPCIHEKWPNQRLTFRGV